jgi:3-oxoacyl-[acyl-carrier-protein] synthase-3
MSIKILGTGRALPKLAVSNQQLSEFLDTTDEWIVSRTGIESRFIRTDETLTDLAHTAAIRALEKAALAASDIDLIICSTLVGDYRTPSLACCLAQRLESCAPAFDINAACTGFLYTLDLAAAYIASGRAQHILIVCAEMMSKHADWTDRSTCVLFGDGAGAVIVSKGNALRHLHVGVEGSTKFLNMHDSTGNSPFVSSPQAASLLYMNGREVFKFAVKAMEKETALALDTLKLTAEDIDFFLVHQANLRIVDFIRTRLQQPLEKFPTNIQRHGNISSASIPVLLDELLEQGKIKQGQTLLLGAFGAGLTSGGAVLVWE